MTSSRDRTGDGGWIAGESAKGWMALKCVDELVGGGYSRVRSWFRTRQLSNGVGSRWQSHLQRKVVKRTGPLPLGSFLARDMSTCKEQQ